MSETPVYLHGIGTAVPEPVHTQETSLEFMLGLVGPTAQQRALLAQVYRGIGIDKRHTAFEALARRQPEFRPGVSDPGILRDPTSRERNEVYIAESRRLALEAVHRLLGRAAADVRSRISHVITVSCTGMSAPGFDLAIAKDLGLPAHVNRLHLGGMGCAAALPALQLARDVCRAEPGARVLVVTVELCSLHVQRPTDADAIVSGALYADGAAAALVSADPADGQGSGMLLRAFRSECLPDSEDDMAWHIGDSGFEIRLSSRVPQIIGAHLAPVVDRLLRDCGLTRDDIDAWAVHPAGRPVLERAAQALRLTADDLALSTEILRNYGNMSSSAILFVLRTILDRHLRGRVVAMAFGPGLTIGTACLEAF